MLTQDEFVRAHERWGANCGPGAIAAMLGLSMDRLRPYLGDFESKRYTNPTLMFETLDRLQADFGFTWSKAKPLAWPRFGLARIQWHGPWTAPGVPARAAYRHTHWVGAQMRDGGIGVFDVNALNNGTGWCSLRDWCAVLVPWLLTECEPRADGTWSLTHVVEISRPEARRP